MGYFRQNAGAIITIQILIPRLLEGFKRRNAGEDHETSGKPDCGAGRI
jgi:hypothetical protein